MSSDAQPPATTPPRQTPEVPTTPKKLLRRLTKASSRKKFLKPGHDAVNGKVKNVRVRLFVKRLIAIDLKQQQFTADVKLECSWLAPDAYYGLWGMMHREQPEKVKADEPPRREILEEGLQRLQWDEKRTNQERGQLEIFLRNRDSSLKRKGPVKGDIKLKQTLFAPALYFRNLLEQELYEEDFEFYLDPPPKPKAKEKADPDSEPKPKPEAGDKADLDPKHTPKPKSEAEDDADLTLLLTYAKSFRGTFQSNFDLHHFPFDEQDLQMLLATAWPREDDDFTVRLERNENAKYDSFVVVDNFLQKASYTLSPHLRFDPSISQPHASITASTYSMLTVTMHVERAYNYWLVSVVAPLFFLTSIMCTSFEVPETDFADRSGITLTALLAMVAFQPSIAERLPEELSYMTFLDLYIAISFTFAFGVILFQSVSAMRSSEFDHPNNEGLQPPGEPAFIDSFDGYTFGVSRYYLTTLFFWVGLHLVLLGVVALVVWRRRTHCHRIWHSRYRRSLWLGPLSTEEIKGKVGPTRYSQRVDIANPDSEWSKEARSVEKNIKQRLNNLQPLTDARARVKDVRLWHPQHAQQALRAEERRVLRSPGHLWWAFDSLFSINQPLPQHTVVPTKAFAVVTMQNERGAEELLQFATNEPRALRKHIERGDSGKYLRGKKLFDSKLALERLNPSWYPLLLPSAVRRELNKVAIRCFVSQAQEQLLQLPDLMPIKVGESTTERLHLHAVENELGSKNSRKRLVYTDGDKELPVDVSQFRKVSEDLLKSEASRKLYGIPKQAKQFAFFYPLAQNLLRQEEEAAATKNEQACLSSGENRPNESWNQAKELLKHGGFLYTNEECTQICGVTRIGIGPCFTFRRRPMSKEEFHHLVPGERQAGPHHLNEVTLPELVELGIRKFCWIPPAGEDSNERPDGEDSNERPDGEDPNERPDSALWCEYGGFAYIYDENRYTKDFDCVFKLMPARPHRRKRKGRGKLEQEREPTSEASGSLKQAEAVKAAVDAVMVSESSSDEGES